MTQWIERWKDWIDPKAIYPGVWRRRDGGFHIQARVIDPKRKKPQDINLILAKETDALKAAQVRAEKIKEVKTGGILKNGSMPLFAEYAYSVLERKIHKGRIKSEAGKEKWEDALVAEKSPLAKYHLIPYFGEIYIDKLTTTDREKWATDLGKLINTGKLSPNTANTWISIFKQIMSAATEEYDLPKDIALKLDTFGLDDHDSYPEEAPNLLEAKDVPLFLTKMKELWPQHYAMCVLGFCCGLRPSSLRPLRRKGPKADVDWEKRILRIRRSHTRG